ncbi:hypothetical protein [Halobacillus halophilus]|uniref:hypothetical protein n=1 Tax=Halobacillus halophilus TaxID=1570 RepID=UPI001CD1D37E|nr:hypothetical protein [Halobacillus halophilus]MCA1010704.1 hypothetical protein [Halobacillus halophilus]
MSYLSSEWASDQLLVEPKELEYLDYEEKALEDYQLLLDSFDSSGINSMEYARGEGVEREWEAYHFFAQEERNAPQEVFHFINDNGQVDYFNQEQINATRNWSQGDPIPIEGMEGHHMKLVSDHPGNIELAADPNNVMFSTEIGHLEYLHGGSTRHATQSEYFTLDSTLDEKFQATLNHNEQTITVSSLEHGAMSIGGGAILSSTIGVLAEWYRLKRDPRPWRVKKSQLIKASIAFGTIGAGLSAIGFMSQHSIETLLSTVDPSILDQTMMDIMGINGTFFVISMSAAALHYYWNIKRGVSKRQAQQELQRMTVIAAGEFLAFSALGIGADILGDLAADTVMDALIPDPTGLVIVSRVAWGLFKAGKKLMESEGNKRAVKECKEVHFTYLHDNALRSRWNGG